MSNLPAGAEHDPRAPWHYNHITPDPSNCLCCQQDFQDDDWEDLELCGFKCADSYILEKFNKLDLTSPKDLKTANELLVLATEIQADCLQEITNKLTTK
jgi:hypothetical protein